MTGNHSFVVRRHCVTFQERHPFYQWLVTANGCTFQESSSLTQKAPLAFWIGTILGYDSALTMAVHGFDATPIPAMPPCVLALPIRTLPLDSVTRVSKIMLSSNSSATLDSELKQAKITRARDITSAVREPKPSYRSRSVHGSGDDNYRVALPRSTFGSIPGGSLMNSPLITNSQII